MPLMIGKVRFGPGGAISRETFERMANATFPGARMSSLASARRAGLGVFCGCWVRCGFCEYYLHNLPNLSPLPADNTKRFEGGKVPSPFCTGGVAVSEDRNTIVTVDGEVYNHADLAGSIRGLNDSKDPTNLPELILQLYEAQGIDFVDKLDGGFALAIWEEHDGKLLLARDRFGQTPLFHTERPGGITFCSDLRALLGDVGFERILDHSAL